MKKLTITLLTTLLTASASISQTSSDTTCLPNEQLKRAINLIEKGKVAEQKVVALQEIVDNAEKRIILKDSIIAKFQSTEATYKSLVENFQKNIDNDKKVIANLEKTITLDRIINRRQKMSKWLVGLAGLGLGFLISK